MGRYRKKPVAIEAVCWTGTNVREVAEFMGAPEPVGAGRFIAIQTLEGTMKADLGDWIIRGVQGEFYPCKPDIFEATYEAVDGDRQLDPDALRAARKAFTKGPPGVIRVVRQHDSYPGERVAPDDPPDPTAYAPLPTTAADQDRAIEDAIRAYLEASS